MLTDNYSGQPVSHRKPPERRWRSAAVLTAATAGAAVLLSVGLAHHGGHGGPSLAADYSFTTTPAATATASRPVQDARRAVAAQVHDAAVRQARLAREAARRQARAARRAAAARQAAAARAAAPAPAPAQAAPPPPSGGILTPAQVGALWERADGSAATEQDAECIAEHESTDNAGATHVDSNGQVDYGLFQIANDPAALNPATGAAVAVSMSDDGADWSQWTTAPDCGL